MDCTDCSGHPMILTHVWDDYTKGYAFNLYVCDGCGKVTKRDVWNNKGDTTILLDGEVVNERS